jgi:hypothetical protein
MGEAFKDYDFFSSKLPPQKCGSEWVETPEGQSFGSESAKLMNDLNGLQEEISLMQGVLSEAQEAEKELNKQ